MGLIQPIYMGWIWEFSMGREESITADTTVYWKGNKNPILRGKK